MGRSENIYPSADVEAPFSVWPHFPDPLGLAPPFSLTCFSFKAVGHDQKSYFDFTWDCEN
jgi:hypothetical protein